MKENIILPVILAGGKSNRFGEDKSIVKLGGKTLLDHTIAKLEKEFSEILIVSNNSKLKLMRNNIYVIRDCMDGQLGPLVGVLSSMKWIVDNNKKYKWVATFPCDTPFFDRKIIKEFKNNSSISKNLLYFINSNNKRHNIFGLWSVELCKTLENDIKLNNFRKVENWANKIGVKTINISHGKFDKFLNINTQEEYKIAKKNLEKLNND